MSQPTYRDVLLGLLPPVSYARNAPAVRRQAEVDARVLDDIQRSAEQALDGALVQKAGSLLPDWERVLGIEPDRQTYGQRIQQVLLRLNALGGLSIPYFIGLAKAAGYTVTITEPQPFRAGVNRAGDRLAREDIMFVWHVNVQSGGRTAYHFRAGSSAAGEPLGSYADSVIEHIINDLKPAHTAVHFDYGA